MEFTLIKTGLIISFFGITIVIILLSIIALTLAGFYSAINEFETRRKKLQKRPTASGGTIHNEKTVQQDDCNEKLEVIAAICIALDLFLRASHHETNFIPEGNNRFDAWKMAGRLQSGGLK